MTSLLPPLPALKALGKLSELRPIVVVDSREQAPLIFTHLPFICRTLPSGDYSALGCEHQFAVERKSLNDLCMCCVGENRERFERELHRLRGFQFKRLLVVGNEDHIRAGKYLSNIKPKAVLGTLAAFEVRYDCPVVFAPDPSQAALMLERWVWWYCRELVQQANALLRGAGSVTDARCDPG
jgi:DNA excision repair protein ERCC-4